jgi:hypothetical protein
MAHDNRTRYYVRKIGSDYTYYVLPSVFMPDIFDGYSYLTEAAARQIVHDLIRSDRVNGRQKVDYEVVAVTELDRD